MAIGTLAFAYNMYKTYRYGAKASSDPWDGRTLEWATASPPLEYNFAQLPRVRGVDALWLQKEVGSKTMDPAEPLGDIHMPSSSYLPILMALGFFIAGLGMIAGKENSYAMGLVGLVMVIIVLFMRSFDRDYGYHIHKEEIEKDLERSGK
jgi:cytochrome c oxidase subunit 1